MCLRQSLGPDLDGGSLLVYDEDARPKRRLSLQAKARIRRKSLERRVRKAAPLFADRIIADELAANPGYFHPIEE